MNHDKDDALADGSRNGRGYRWSYVTEDEALPLLRQLMAIVDME